MPQVANKDLEFTTVQENWNQYRLADGRIVRVKFVPIWIREIVDADGNPQYRPDGDQEMAIQGQVLIGVSAGPS